MPDRSCHTVKKGRVGREFLFARGMGPGRAPRTIAGGKHRGQFGLRRSGIAFAKLANQAIVGITIGAVSEALLLAAKGGARPEKVREALLGGFAGSKILEQHGERMLQRNFEPGAPARIQLKDLRMILDEARSEGLTLPLSQRVFEEYRALLASGNGEVDHSGLLLELERLNGVRLGSADEEH